MLALFALTLVGLASAGSIIPIVYDPATSTGSPLSGLVMNGSFFQTFASDNLNNATIDSPPWYTNSSGTVTFTEGTSGGVNFIGASSGVGLGDIGNFTWFINLNQSQDTNTTFFLLATPTLAEVRIADCFWGCTTQSAHLKNASVNVPARVPVSVYFNFTRKTIEYYQSGALANTIDVTSYGAIYMVFTARGNSAVGSDVQVQHYINSTKSGIINTSTYNQIPAFVYWANSTTGYGINATGLASGGIVLGTVNFSTHIKNYWMNTTEVATTDDTYFYFLPNTTLKGSVQNNASMFLTILDEENQALLVKYSLTIANSTNTTTYGNGSSVGFFWSNWTGIPNGVLTVTVTNSTDYYPRSYAFNFNAYPQLLAPSYHNATLYLLRQSVTSQVVTFTILGNAGTPLNGAVVKAEKLINGNYVVVDQKTTDVSGIAALFLSSTTQYRITVVADGFPTFVTLLTPTSASYTITLGTGGSTNFTGFFYNLTYDTKPLDPTLKNDTSSIVDINFTVLSTDLKVASMRMNVTHGNGTVLFDQTLTGNSGGFLNYSVNVSSVSGNLTVGFFISRSDMNTTFYLTRVYHIYQYRPFGFRNTAALLATYADQWTLVLLSIIISLGVTIFFSKFVGFGSGLVTVCMLGLFVAVGWVPWVYYLPVVVLTVAMFLTGRLNF